MVKYLGSKRVLLPAIAAAVAELPVDSAADLFAGTTRVSQALRRLGLRVHANDTASYSEALAQAYVVADGTLDRGRIRDLLAHLSALPGTEGYVTETFCRASRFFQPHNGMRIDAIRDEIERLELSEIERGVLLTSLLEAADRVDSTCGLQMAYVKQWAPRSHRELELREPAAVPGPAGSCSRADANELAGRLEKTDLAYLDPPYNQHSYFSNYHVWETLVRWDAPAHYGVACKRVDCRTEKSAYNSRPGSWPALAGLIAALPTPWIVMSFSDEGFHEPDALVELLSGRGHVRTVGFGHARYVGARIGIHNPAGERVGAVSHVRNRELLLIAGPDGRRVDAAASAAIAAVASPQRAAA